MPAFLRPCGPICERVILVSDPVRAMALAQALTEQPVMANHAHGLWGYHGRTPSGAELNVQAGGIGGPSTVAVLADLAELGVHRVARVGACVALDARITLGEPVVARMEPGPPEAVSGEPGPDSGAGLPAILEPAAARVRVGRSPVFPGEGFPEDADACDLETPALLRAAPLLGIDVGAILVPDRLLDGGPIEAVGLDAAIEGAGRAADRAL